MSLSMRRGLGYTLVAQIATMGFQFANSIVLTRGLGAYDYGLYSLMFNGAVGASTLADAGLSMALVKFVAESDAKDDHAGSFSALLTALTIHGIMIALFALVSLFVFPTVTAIWFDGNLYIYGAFAISTVSLLLTADLTGALFGFRELVTTSNRMLLQAVFLCTFGFIAVTLLHGGLRVAADIFAITTVLLLLWLGWFVAQLIRKGRMQVSRKFMFRPMILFALPLAMIFPLQAMLNMAPIFLTKVFGTSAQINQEIANISLAILLGNIAQSLLTTMIRAASGYFSRWYMLARIDLLQRMVFAFQLFTLLAYGMILLVTYTILPTLIELIYGRAYAGVNNYMLLSLFVSFTKTSTTLFNLLLNSMGLPRISMTAGIVEFVLYCLFLGLAYRLFPSQDWGQMLLAIGAVAGGAKVVFLWHQGYRRLDRAKTEASRSGAILNQSNQGLAAASFED